MRPFLFISILFFSLCIKAACQTVDTLTFPKVLVAVSFSKETFKIEDDIKLTITLRNGTVRTQSVWFDKPKSATGGPAWTSVTVTNEKTGESVLKYQNKRILESQAYSTKQVKSFCYQLESGQSVKGRFSLYDIVITNTKSYKLNKGTYIMQVFYATNPSNIISFTVD